MVNLIIKKYHKFLSVCCGWLHCCFVIDHNSVDCFSIHSPAGFEALWKLGYDLIFIWDYVIFPMHDFSTNIGIHNGELGCTISYRPGTEKIYSADLVLHNLMV